MLFLVVMLPLEQAYAADPPSSAGEQTLERTRGIPEDFTRQGEAIRDEALNDLYGMRIKREDLWFAGTALFLFAPFLVLWHSDLKIQNLEQWIPSALVSIYFILHITISGALLNIFAVQMASVRTNETLQSLNSQEKEEMQKGLSYLAQDLSGLCDGDTEETGQPLI